MEMSPELLIVGVVVLIVAGVLVIFGIKPTDDRVGTPSSGGEAHPANSGLPGPSAAYRESGATAIAALLYVAGGLLLLAGAILFGLAETSIHEILSTLIGLMGAIFFAAGAVVTELQRIKKQLQADATKGSVSVAHAAIDRKRENDDDCLWVRREVRNSRRSEMGAGDSGEAPIKT
jgi:hypothetical protein